MSQTTNTTSDPVCPGKCVKGLVGGPKKEACLHPECPYNTRPKPSGHNLGEQE